MSENYYTNSLYPLQNKVLQLVEKIDNEFYLTGGTALGRVYLGHRYSDDLDLFVNSINDFKQKADTIIVQLEENFPGTEINVLFEDFARIFIPGEKNPLKIELINDVSFHTGDIGSADFFHRIDSWENILSNKICALSRDDAKDIADLVYLSIKYQFTWETVINNARNKDTWVNEVEVSRLLHEFDSHRLTRLNWINTPDFNQLKEYCKIISKDIIDGGPNSIVDNQK